MGCNWALRPVRARFLECWTMGGWSLFKQLYAERERQEGIHCKRRRSTSCDRNCRPLCQLYVGPCVRGDRRRSKSCSRSTNRRRQDQGQEGGEWGRPLPGRRTARPNSSTSFEGHVERKVQ